MLMPVSGCQYFCGGLNHLYGASILNYWILMNLQRNRLRMNAFKENLLLIQNICSQIDSLIFIEAYWLMVHFITRYSQFNNLNYTNYQSSELRQTFINQTQNAIYSKDNAMQEAKFQSKIESRFVTVPFSKYKYLLLAIYRSTSDLIALQSFILICELFSNYFIFNKLTTYLMKKSHVSRNNSKQANLYDSSFSESGQQQASQNTQYFLLNQRIANVQMLLTKLSKRTHKIERQISQVYPSQASAFDTLSIEKQVRNQIKKIHQFKDHRKDSSQLDFSQFLDIKDLLIREIKSQLKQTVQKAVTKIQNKAQSVFQKLQNQKGLKSSNLAQQLKELYKKNKAYIDKSIESLKISVNQFSKQKGKFSNIYLNDNQRLKQGNYNSLLNESQSVLSISNMRYSSSSKQTKNQAFTKNQGFQRPMQNLQNIKSSQNLRKNLKQNSSSVSKLSSSKQGNNRVSYLRQKLLEFQKINQKYEKTEQKFQQRSGRKLDLNSSTKAVQKMKDLKNFLQESQSQIEPSQIISNNALLSSSQKPVRKSVEKRFNTDFRK